MKTQIFVLVATAVAVFASSMVDVEECSCSGACMKTVTEDGQCNSGYLLGVRIMHYA